MTLSVFGAGDGINVTKLNDNFSELQNKTNTNESAINDFDTYALRKDGTNLTQSIIADFQKQTPNVITAGGTISLQDNTANFLTLTSNGTIQLPTVSADAYSHTINLTVQGGSYTLNVSAATSNHHLYNSLPPIDITNAYNVLFIYNKIDRYWYYSITQ